MPNPYTEMQSYTDNALATPKKWKCSLKQTLGIFSECNIQNAFSVQHWKLFVWESTAIQHEIISQPPLHRICSLNPMLKSLTGIELVSYDVKLLVRHMFPWEFLTSL